MSTTQVLPRPLHAPSANDRLKERTGDWFWSGILVATAMHFALLALWPEIRVQDVDPDSSPSDVIEIPEEHPVPPPPADISRPAVPIPSTDLRIDPDVTIGTTVFTDNPPENLPQPPTGGQLDVSEQPTFTPYEVKPELRDRAGFARLLERRYPHTLRDAGIDGTVVLWVFVDETGTVKSTRVTRSSGYEQLDQVAREVMAEARFTPALNRDQKVAVWIQLPVSFQTR